jgi:[acyl-carrier-protein] S-malonyltransferase
MGNLALVFPGQGTQYTGMGRDLYAEFASVRDIFDRAGASFGFDMARLCFEGPQEALDMTVNTQTTILTLEVAVYTLCREFLPMSPQVAAGHSLGEYSAIYASGAISLEDLFPLVYARAQYHQDAVPLGSGAMAAIIGLDHEEVRHLCREVGKESEVVAVSVLNAPRQTSISGHTNAVERVMAAAKEIKSTAVIKLPISVPCHCELLQTASDSLAENLRRITFGDFQIPVIPNCDPNALYTPENARDLLRRQIISPVRWHETVEKMVAMGVETILEIGPKKTLSGLIKKIDKRIQVMEIGDLKSFRKAQEFFNTAR